MNLAYMMRGGSWYNKPVFVRSALRVRINTDIANFSLGFRIIEEY